MATDQILSLLIAERDKLNRAIEILGTPEKRLGRPPKSATAKVEAPALPAKKVRKKHTFSPEQLEAASKRMKDFWAKKRKAAKKAS